MAQRIYAFAKELKLENHQILEICEKLGIKGKGSALASLEDDEIAKVRSYLAEAAAASSPAAAKKAAAPAPAAASQPQRDVSQPARTTPLRDLDERPKRKKSEEDAPPPKRDAAKKKVPTASALMAAMPEVQQPVVNPQAHKEKVQKPDIALPQEALRKHRAGGGLAPLEQYTARTKEKTQDKPKKKGKAKDEPQAPIPVMLRDMPGKTRVKRDKDSSSSVVDSELGSTRQQRVRRRERDVTTLDGEDDRLSRRKTRRKVTQATSTAAPRREKITIGFPCTIRLFSEACGVSAVQVLLALPKIGEVSLKNINSELSRDQVELLLHEFSIGHVELKEEETIEQRVLDRLDPKNDPPESLAPRPPIVTFLGHVDHGKTSLLDAIIGTNVVAGEAGGITQHIRAYQIKKDNRKIAFVDTPGHEAFTEMRARGANVTDIAVLVIAADDGIMPQTEEAISHAKAAGVPIIVALNKIDLPGANPDKVLQELTAHDLIPSQWGGDVEVVPTSAIKGTGIDELLETILVTAELHDLKANPQRSAYGMCLEAEQESGRGVIAKMMVQGGALHPGDIVLCGAAHGRVKAMYDTLRPNVRLDKAGPSTPINLTGLDRPPQAGDKFFVLEDIGEARQLALACETRHRQLNLGGATIKVSLEQFQQMIESGTLGKVEDIVTLNLIIRADVRGSIEAIQKELSKIEHPEVRINILQALVGGVTIADVRLAQASRAVIIGFNVVPDEAARILAEDLQVEIRRYDIIYKVSDDIKATLEGRLKPQEQVVEMGMALVLRTFAISRVGTVAGCRVMRGTIQRDCRMRVIRDSRVIGEYAIDSLKREKDDAREVQRGMECGIRLVGFNDVKEGDTLEAYKIEQVARTL